MEDRSLRSPLRDGHPVVSNSAAFAPRDTGTLSPHPSPPPPPRPPSPREEVRSPPLPSQPADSPGRSPARQENRALPLRLSSSPGRSPGREEDRAAPRGGPVPRLASLLQQSPAGEAPHLPPAHQGAIPLPLPSPTVNRAARDDTPAVTKLEGDGDSDVERGSRVVSWILRRRRRGKSLGKAAIGVRLSAVALSLVSFSVMAADKTQGWAGDSFDRYREYRFCITVNILTFIYSGFQAYAQAHRLIHEKDIIGPSLRCFFDFAMDQVLAYLLIAASSAAATRNDDWVSNWGSDPFTVMANGSISVSFLAFVTLAVSALISAHSLFGRAAS